MLTIRQAQMDVFIENALSASRLSESPAIFATPCPKRPRHTRDSSCRRCAGGESRWRSATALELKTMCIATSRPWSCMGSASIATRVCPGRARFSIHAKWTSGRRPGSLNCESPPISGRRSSDAHALVNPNLAEMLAERDAGQRLQIFDQAVGVPWARCRASSGRLAGENLPGNRVWNGSQVRYLDGRNQEATGG